MAGLSGVSSGGGAGTVTSVALALPASVFSVSGSPVTTNGTLTGAFVDQAANTVFAGPTSGVDATPTFRALVAADMPAGFGPQSWTSSAGAFAPNTSVIASGDTINVDARVANTAAIVAVSIRNETNLTASQAVILNVCQNATGSAASKIFQFRADRHFYLSPGAGGTVIANIRMAGATGDGSIGPRIVFQKSATAVQNYVRLDSYGSTTTAQAALHLRNGDGVGVFLDDNSSGGAAHLWITQDTKLSFDGTPGTTASAVGDTYFTKLSAGAGPLELFFQAAEVSRWDAGRIGMLASLRPGVDSAMGTALSVFTGAMGTQYTDVTVTNTVTKTDLLSGTVQGTLTIPAARMRQGSTYRVRLRGYWSTAASAGTVTVTMDLGGTTIVATGAETVADSVANGLFEIDFQITCQTTGATGTVIGGGHVAYTTGTGIESPTWIPAAPTAAVTVDTTGALAVTVNVTWGTADAGNTLTITTATLEELN